MVPGDFGIRSPRAASSKLLLRVEDLLSRVSTDAIMTAKHDPIVPLEPTLGSSGWSTL